MKLHGFALMLVLTALVTSFAPGMGEDDKDKGGVVAATIDGVTFKPREDQTIKGIIVSKAGAMDGHSLSKNMINITAYGPSYDLDSMHTFSENINFEIQYQPDSLGAPNSFVVALQYQRGDYSMVVDDSKISITQFNWEEDHKHFRFAADFDCKMRSWGYPMDDKGELHLKGKIYNVRVTVPGWIALKN